MTLRELVERSVEQVRRKAWPAGAFIQVAPPLEGDEIGPYVKLVEAPHLRGVYVPVWALDGKDKDWEPAP